MPKAKLPYAFSIVMVSAMCIYAADKPKKPAPQPSITGEARLIDSFVSRNGKTSKVQKIRARVLIRSADAAKAFAYGFVKWDKAIDGTGKTLKFTPPFVSFNDPTKQFVSIKRGGPFAKHPKDGVSVPADLDPMGRQVKSIKLLSGTVKLKISDARRSWVVPVSALKVPAALNGESSHADAALKKLGYTLKIQMQEMSINKKKSHYYQFAFVDSAKRLDLIDKIEFLDSKKMPAKDLNIISSDGRMTMGAIRYSTIDLDAQGLAKLKKLKGYLRISVFAKVSEKVVPFKVENFKVTKGGFGF